MKGEGHGYGKVILFNEHFVVYGIPAIASAIGMKTIAIVEPSEKFELVDNRLETPGYKKEKLEQQKQSLENIFKAMNLKPDKIRITLSGDLIAASGVGASAASCVSIARALDDYYKLGLDNEKINQIAYEGEKAYHGNPSGIDNTASTYGGLIWYQRTPDRIIMDRLPLKEPVEIVIGNTGKVANTKLAVQGVRERKEKYPEKYNKIFKEAEEMVYDARSALETFDLNKIGDLMNKNHKLLQQIEVSSPELDFLVEIALDNGAIGAKMTGGGLGGNMIALTPGRDLQEKVAKAMEKKGFQTMKTTLGG